MKIKKEFVFTLAHKFPNSDIASIHFGTTEELEGILEGIPEEEVDRIASELADKVYQATMDDIKTYSKTNPIIREILNGIKHGVKVEANEREAEKMLEDD